MTLKQQIQLLNQQAEMIKQLREEMMAELAALERIHRVCEHPDCIGIAVGESCDGCDARFCEEHGHRGGDALVGDCLTAVPATCWRCMEAAYA